MADLQVCPKCGYELKKTKVSRLTFESIINYLNRKTGKSFKSTTSSTRGLIKARIAEGFTEDDFLVVIDNQCRKWLTDPKMMEYLRPQTLFCTKFESYLQDGRPKTPEVKKRAPKDSIGDMNRALNILCNLGEDKFNEFCKGVRMPEADKEAVLYKYNGTHDLSKLPQIKTVPGKGV